jgi:hypothetical protein
LHDGKVVGTSLAVWSSYRLAQRAHKQGKPIVILNRGPNRAAALVNGRADVAPRVAAEPGPDPTRLDLVRVALLRCFAEGQFLQAGIADVLPAAVNLAISGFVRK